MNRTELEARTKTFAVHVIRFVSDLPKNKIADVLTYQLLRSATSIGANYREANRAASRNDFIHKINLVEKEASETQYWLELLEEAQLGDCETRYLLHKEASELVAIFTRVGRSTKSNNHKFEIRNPKFEME